MKKLLSLLLLAAMLLALCACGDLNETLDTAQQVMDAALAGAVEKLLVLDSKVREQDLDDVVRAVESQKGTVIVVSGQHDGGKQLAAIGGMGALLRYRIDV